MRSTYWNDAVDTVRKAGLYNPADATGTLDAIATVVAASMAEPYGAQWLARFRATLTGSAPKARAEKSPRQRSRATQRPAVVDRTESTAVVAERTTAKRARGSKRCPQCGRGAGFGSAFCQYDGSALN